MKECPSCSIENEDSAPTCIHCGTILGEVVPVKEAEGVLEWEHMRSRGHAHISVWRARVPGGWLVTASHLPLAADKVDERGRELNLVFIPDPSHRWASV